VTAFRKKHYKSLDEIEEDLDIFMNKYNKDRTNQGKRCKGKTPYETFLGSIDLYKNMVYRNEAEEIETEKKFEVSQETPNYLQ